MLFVDATRDGKIQRIFNFYMGVMQKFVGLAFPNRKLVLTASDSQTRVGSPNNLRVYSVSSSCNFPNSKVSQPLQTILRNSYKTWLFKQVYHLVTRSAP